MIDILILTGEPSERRQLAGWLLAGWNVVSVANLREAEAFLEEPGARAFVCSDELPDESGLMFIARTQSRWPHTRRILMATDLDGSLFFHTMHEVDVFSYLRRPFNRGEFIRTMSRAVNEPEAPSVEVSAGQQVPCERVAGWCASVGVTVGLVVASVALVLLLLVVAYLLKSALGVDIFPDWHLGDLLRD